MELRHLRYFVATAEELNITRAATRLRVSQPPLSRQIRDLEDEVGTALFDRSNRRLKLTPAGEYFLKEAKIILLHTQRAARVAKATAMGQAGQIRIAFVSPLGGMFLPRIARAFRQRFPLFDVDLLEMVPRMQLDALLDNQADLAFVALPEVESADGFAFEPVMDVQLRLALSKDHPLAKLTRIPMAKLREQPFVVLQRSAAPKTHDLLVRLCRSAGFEPNIAKQSDRAQSILDLVAAGVGVSIVPQLFERYQACCVTRQLIPAPAAVPICMVWRRNETSPALRALCSMIRTYFRHRSAGGRIGLRP